MASMEQPVRISVELERNFKLHSYLDVSYFGLSHVPSQNNVHLMHRFAAHCKCVYNLAVARHVCLLTIGCAEHLFACITGATGVTGSGNTGQTGTPGRDGNTGFTGVGRRGHTHAVPSLHPLNLGLSWGRGGSITLDVCFPPQQG